MGLRFNEARKLETSQKRLVMEVLDLALEQLDLSASDLEKIESAYRGVGNYLASCEHPLLRDSLIYPQGSVRMRTSVKPLSKEEFDVDLILYLPHASGASRDDINDVVWQHLKAHKVYGPLTEKLARGFRINYKGNYHLDITPAKEYPYEDLPGQPLLVVDKRFEFKESNPEGAAQGFDEACRVMPKILKRMTFTESLEANTVQDLPDQSDKKPLNRITQVFKRHRDVWASNEDNHYGDFKPISVLLTTLARLAYLRVVNSGKAFESEFDLLLDVVELMPTFIEQANDEYRVENPSMRQENYAEKWNRKEKMEGAKLQQAFVEWHRAAVFDFEMIAQSSEKGMDTMFKTLSTAFGERPVNSARDRILESISNSRDKGRLGVVATTGAITAAASATANAKPATASLKSTNSVPVIPIKKNRFYGDQ